LSQTSIWRNGDRHARIKQTPKSGKEVKHLCEAAASLGGGAGAGAAETTKTPPPHTAINHQLIWSGKNNTLINGC